MISIVTVPWLSYTCFFQFLCLNWDPNKVQILLLADVSLKFPLPLFLLRFFCWRNWFVDILVSGFCWVHHYIIYSSNMLNKVMKVINKKTLVSQVSISLVPSLHRVLSFGEVGSERKSLHRDLLSLARIE